MFKITRDSKPREAQRQHLKHVESVLVEYPNKARRIETGPLGANEVARDVVRLEDGRGVAIITSVAYQNGGATFTTRVEYP